MTRLPLLLLTLLFSLSGPAMGEYSDFWQSSLAARRTNNLPMGPGAANVDEFGRMGNQTVRISDLTPPASRPFADPAKLQRHGDFDWQKYSPITVDRLPSGRLEIMDGMTRVENARRAGITELPANVYPRR